MPLRRILIGWACVLWILGSGGTQLHDVMYTHIMCPEHGVLEHAPDTADVASAHDSGPSILSADKSSHGEECPFECIPSSAALVPAPAPGLAYVLKFAEPSPFVHVGAPRGPPLAYAPKTSPPIAT